MVLVKIFPKLCNEITHENSGIVFQEITLNLPLRLQNQKTGTSHSLDDFYDHCADIVSDTVDYINDRFGEYIFILKKPYF